MKKLFLILIVVLSPQLVFAVPDPRLNSTVAPDKNFRMVLTWLSATGCTYGNRYWYYQWNGATTETWTTTPAAYFTGRAATVMIQKCNVATHQWEDYSGYGGSGYIADGCAGGPDAWTVGEDGAVYLIDAPFEGEWDITQCGYEPPPPCEQEMADLVEACGQDETYVKAFDYELCEGYCKDCSELAQGCTDYCEPHIVSSYTCDGTQGEVGGEQHTVALSVSPCLCGDQDCNDLADQCAAGCGGLENVKAFQCADNQVIVPCECNEATPPYDPGDFDTSVSDENDPDSVEPPVDPEDPEDTQENMAHNLYEIANNTHTIKENSKAIADNTEKIGQILNTKLSEVEKSLHNMAQDIDKMAETPNTVDTEQSMQNSIDEGQDTLKDEIQDIQDNAPLSDSLLDDFYDYVGDLFPSVGTCQPYTFEVASMGVSLNFGCDWSDRVKSILAWVFAVLTIWSIVDLIFEVKPGGQ